jgi:thiopurine S-methyltransferase
VSSERAFWDARWREGRIGFHEGRANEHLQRVWPDLNLRAEDAVLVPLCGKSHDLTWLAARGHRVIGVEFSPDAVAAFFAEQGLTPQRKPAGALEAWSAGSLTILLGDFFAVDPLTLAQLCGGSLPVAWWDRAAVVALPPPTRAAYAQHLAGLLAPGARGLLLCLEYRQEEMPGPPFAVDAAEVQARFGPPRFSPPRELGRWELDVAPDRRALGVTRLCDVLWRLARPEYGVAHR